MAPKARGRGAPQSPGFSDGGGGRGGRTPSNNGRGGGGGRASPASAGRGYRGSPGGGRGGTFPLASRVHTGPAGDAVSYSKDKEAGLWKVGPVAPARFGPAFLRGLSSFTEWKLGQASSAEGPAASAASSAHPGGSSGSAMLAEEEAEGDTASSHATTADAEEEDAGPAVGPAPPSRAPGGRQRSGRAPAPDPFSGQVQLSIRLEHQMLTDPEACLLADWCGANPAAAIRKLWLFDNRLGDGGAGHVARILAQHPAMQEIHLSHNMLGLPGAAALLTALPAGRGAAGTRRPCWLRLEWNRLSLAGLMEELEAQYAERGLLIDLPVPLREDAAPALPALPAYLAAAAAGEQAEAGQAQSPLPPNGQLGGRGARNSLRFLAPICHARLPWVSCQYETPAEAAVLRAACTTWQKSSGAAPPPPPPRSSPATRGQAPAAAGPSSASRGPLLLFPDTSALLPMLGASAAMATPTLLTLDALGALARAGRFGRALPPAERVFIIISDTVMKQLDGLKNDPGARSAVRSFLGAGLDAWGPAGADFLTVLGAHEGEGLLVEHDAAVAGSESGDVATKGQRADHRIVEVALFFQQQLLEAAGRAGIESRGVLGKEEVEAEQRRRRQVLGEVAVLLLSGDNAQVQLAKSHGLPAVRMSELAVHLQPLLAQQTGGGGALTATALRQALAASALKGLGSVATKSVQQEFDGAVSCLRATADALAEALASLEAVRAAAEEPVLEAALQAVRAALAAVGSGGGGGLLAAVQAQLPRWEGTVRTQVSPSRVLKWVQ